MPFCVHLKTHKGSERLVKGPVLDKAQVSRQLKLQRTSPGPALLLHPFSHRKEPCLEPDHAILKPCFPKDVTKQAIRCRAPSLSSPKPLFTLKQTQIQFKSKIQAEPLSVEPSPAPCLAGMSLDFLLLVHKKCSATPWRGTGVLWGAQQLLAGKVGQVCPMGMPYQASLSILGFIFLFG